MRIGENLFIYFGVAVVMYLINTMDIELFWKLVEYSIISITIGKTIEILSYFISAKIKFNIFTALLFSLTVQWVVLGIMKRLGLVDSVWLVYLGAAIVTILMTVYSYYKVRKYNQKLEEVKKRLREDELYENN